MNIERERAAFEWWASDEGENPRAKERVGGCYKLAQIQSYWMAWQARAALQSQDKEDAERYRYLTTKLQQAYDGDYFETDRMSLYCHMPSQYKGERTVRAEITWRDKTDEPIGLNEAIDHARRVEGEA